MGFIAKSIQKKIYFISILLYSVLHVFAVRKVKCNRGIMGKY